MELRKSEGFTPLPNFLVDERYLAELPNEAVTLLIVLNRHIRGYHAQERTFTTTLAMQLAGFKDVRTASKYLKVLVDWQLADVKKIKGKASIYSLNFSNPKPTQFLLNRLQESYDVGTLHAGGKHASDVGSPPTQHVGLIKKEINKENKYKKENPVEDVLQLWTPEMMVLNTWLERSGEKKMTAQEVEPLLLQLNAHYETKLKAELLTSNQMYANFVKWIQRRPYHKNSNIKNSPKIGRMEELEKLSIEEESLYF